MKTILAPADQRMVIAVTLLIGFAVLLGALTSNTAVLNFLQ